MKLRAIYSNDPAKFPRIDFLNSLNVVFAKVRDPRVQNKDSHNLGKTFLVRVIDFALLAGVDKDHPFRVHDILFGEFVFYLELETNDGKFVTIKRSVKGRKCISINVATEPSMDYSSLGDDQWLHPDLSEDKGRALLDELLNLQAVRPYDYRKGLGYFLRRQDDYGNEFMTSRFGRGKDRDWKPFLALMLGLDYDLVEAKYDLDVNEDQLKTSLKDAQQRGGAELEEYDELRGMIELKSREIADYRRKVDAFDFADIESDITRDTVRTVESQIADLNQRHYELEQEIVEIERSLRTEFGFNLEAIKAIFVEAGVALPDALVRDYQQLLDFNRRLSSGRKERLGTRRSAIASELDDLTAALKRLNEQRMAALAVVTQKETIHKFRDLQQRVLEEQSQLGSMRQRLSELDLATKISEQLRRVQEKKSKVIEQLQAMVRKDNPRYTIIRKVFAELARDILFHPAILSTAVNLAGNLEFKTRVIESDASQRQTAEGDGASYKKVLCACFDLALLASHSDASFYRFAYHDGIFEGLDNRRKVSLLATLRRVCDSYGLQYILTVIDSDLPRNDGDQKVLFDKTEIVRELNDGGDAGRLFRMPPF